ncbi:MAG: nucleoside 2-deoxyribosyltransferase, partial [Candidatus Omnitrophica bacterium]|nr:nucleoside 2-deoxyribosyltransferase [Candidatus Omnitrophota bacterium]
GVYFEAGFAYGLGIPVIWCCREDNIKKLHFDTRQYNHLLWSNAKELKNKLISRIKATIL